jgi:hypothetical protein
VLLSNGGIIGVVVGGVLGIVIIILLAVDISLRVKQRSRPKKTSPADRSDYLHFDTVPPPDQVPPPDYVDTRDGKPGNVHTNCYETIRNGGNTAYEVLDQQPPTTTHFYDQLVTDDKVDNAVV